MTLWQDQTSRRSRAGEADDPALQGAGAGPGRPLSRREARELERRAEEAEARSHPSGVVDFSAPDIRDLEAGGAFRDPNSTDIWEALNRRDMAPPTEALRAAPPTPASGIAPVTPAAGLPPVSDDLMDRVRAAVLRRSAIPQTADEPTAVVPVVQAPQPTRRQLREQVAAETTEDGMPASWFQEPSEQIGLTPIGVRVAEQPAVPAAFAHLPEPDELPDTRAYTALDRAALEARSPMTAPVNLPQFFVEPAGADALTFSDRVPLADAEPHGAHPAARAQPAFVEPRPETTETDLAGFEALIKRARDNQAESPSAPAAAPREAFPQTPSMFKQPAPQPIAKAAPKSLPWLDDAEDEHDGFDGVVRRDVAAPRGSANALIMPSDPAPADITQAVSGTGDIFITGTHHLPRRLSTTGATSKGYDSADVDRLFEAGQDEPAAGVAPVRAARAVSGSAAARAVVGPRRVGSNSLPTVLAVIAGVMAVGVMALLVGSWVLRLF